MPHPVKQATSGTKVSMTTTLISNTTPTNIGTQLFGQDIVQKVSEPEYIGIVLVRCMSRSCQTSTLTLLIL